MTSEDNHLQTVLFFEKNNFFGLDRNRIDFFKQKNCFYLDEDGNAVYRAGKKVKGPSGNGDVLCLIKETCLLEKYKNLEIEYLNVISVDNPLADPFDPYLLGCAVENKADIAAVAIKKEKKAQMGLFAFQGKETSIVEYSELNEEEKKNFQYANANIYSFSLNFIERNKFDLPVHFAKKSIKIGFKEKSIYKPEKFIFDVFKYSKKTAVLLSLKKECFAPLKNFKGPFSFKYVQGAMYKRDRDVLKNILKKDIPNKLFELSYQFYYPEEELVKKINSKDLDYAGFIEL